MTPKSNLLSLLKPQGRTARPASDASHIPWFLVLLTLAGYLLLKDYGFGDGDHDDFVPHLLHLLDPGTLATDWYVASQAEQFGPRTVFLYVMLLPSKLLGPSTAFAVGFLACFGAIAAAIYALTFEITRDRLTAAGAVVAVLLATPKFTLGGNDIVGPQLSPSLAAWTLSIWGMVMHLRQRTAITALLFGLAASLQALVGLHVALLGGVLMLWEHRPWRAIFTYAGIFVGCAILALGPMVLQQWHASTTEPSLFYILFEFRAPHHYIPTRFYRPSALAFFGLLVMGLVSLRLIPSDQRVFPLRALGIIGGMCLIGLVGIELFRSEFVGKLQLFRMTVFAKVVLALLVSAAIGRHLPQTVRRLADWVFDHSRLATLGAVLVLGMLTALSPDALGFRPPPVTTESPAPLQVAEWARTSTPPEAIFAIPPSWHTFRSKAERGVVVTFKAVPFTNEYNLEWFHRILAIAPVDTSQQQRMLRLIPDLDAAFFAQPEEKAMEVSRTYDADYLVRRRTLGSPSEPDPVFVASDVVVLRVEKH